MSDTPQYLSLKVAQAAKTGQGSAGLITYRILTDPKHQTLYLTLVANQGGGWFSNEIVPLSHIEDVLASLPDRHQPLPSKLFRQAFASRSVNNAGFLAAVLRAEGLLAPAPEAAHQHVLTDGWDQWTEHLLSEPGEPYVPSPPKGATDTPKPGIANAKQEKAPKPPGKRKGRLKAGSNSQNEHDSETLLPSTDTLPGDGHSEPDPMAEDDNASAA
jgi:hypothetical protein